jgi:hypothetical protein
MLGVNSETLRGGIVYLPAIFRDPGPYPDF